MPDDDDPARKGLWEPIQYRFNYLPIHMALLHTGKVLGFGGSGNDETHLNNPHPAELFDPKTGEIKIIDQTLDGDLFCAGHSFLSDGTLLVAGGTYKYDGKLLGAPVPPFSGLEQSYLFDPVTETWTRSGDMGNGRWYPTLITLADGQVLALGGLTKNFPWIVLRTIEIYSRGAGWRKLDGADRWMPLYPRLHLLPDGRVFYAGSFNTHYTFPFTLAAFPTSTLDVKYRKWTVIGPPNKSEREEGASILLPLTPPDYKPKVLLVGGGTTQGADAIPDAEIIDLSQPNPVWRQIQPMKFPRYYVYAVILPDRKVLVLGGRRGEKGMGHMGEPGGDMVPQDPNAIHEAELFDPDTEEWTTMAAMKLDRLYHANALLLPDGRVMAAGSNPDRRINELRIETYRPPYLCQGTRPTIQDAPSQISYGNEFPISTPDADDLEAIALIRPTATTHCTNTEQRYVGLPIISRGPGKVVAKVPENHALVPPGYYMLFIARGSLPSEAKIVRLA